MTGRAQAVQAGQDMHDRKGHTSVASWARLCLPLASQQPWLLEALFLAGLAVRRQASAP